MQQKKLSVAILGFAKLVFIITLVGLVGACGKKHNDEKSSQSLVSVNGDEITVHQVNNELQRANVQPEQQQTASRQIVKNLVDRQILVQAALKDNLDHKPLVMQLIENAKAQILAEVYLENRFSSIGKPTSTEIADYRAQHQNIFANRKIYTTDQVVFTLGAANSEQIKTIVKSKSIQELEQWLNSHSIKYKVTRVPHPAETLPPQLLTKFGQMILGQLIFINSNDPNGMTEAISMAEIKEMPISEKDSIPLIEKILIQQKRKLAVEAEMKRLRDGAKIEYINKDYDPNNAPKLEKSKPSVELSEGAKEQSSTKMENSVNKGLNGL